MPAAPTAVPVAEDAVYGKVARRIIPLWFLCYIAAYLDRVNVSFAKLQMQSDVPQISDTVFGLGTGIFFWELLGIVTSRLFRQDTLSQSEAITVFTSSPRR
jgi:hypothetical protein